jgi:hypothetical protein
MSIYKKSKRDKSPYKLEFKHYPEYLHVLVGEGIDSLEISTKYWIEILDECEKKGISRVLIDEDLEGSLSSNESYQLSVMLADTKLKDILIAFVDRHREHNESNQFSELIYTNRGGRCKLFGEIEDARQWLLSN